MTAFRSNRILDGVPSGRQCLVELVPQCARRGAMLSRPLQEPDHERRMRLGRPGLGLRRRLFEGTGEPIRVSPVSAARRQNVGPHSQVLDQCQLQRARPRPQLADREWCHRLKRGDETAKTLRVEASRAAANQLEGHRVHTWFASKLVSGQSRQASGKRRGQVVLNVAYGRRNDVEVVEQPFGGRRRGFTASHVFGQRRIDIAKRSRVIVEPSQVRTAATAPTRCKGEQRRQTPRVLLQVLDAEQLDVARHERLRAQELRHVAPRPHSSSNSKRS